MGTFHPLHLRPVHKIMLRIIGILAVVLIAGAARLRAVDLLHIDYDEDDYLRAGQQVAEAIKRGDWAALTELNYRTEHPPLAKIAYGVALLGLPDAPEIPDRSSSASPAGDLPEPHLHTARLTAAAFSTLTVLLLALINPLAGLFLGIHTFTIKYGAEVMLEALPALTSALTVVAYERSKVYEHGKLSAWLMASAAALGLTASGKYLYCVVGVAILFHWGWSVYRSADLRRRDALRRLLLAALAWGLLSLAVFFATDPYLWPSPIEHLKESILFHGAYSQSVHVANAGLPPWQPLIWLLSTVPWQPEVFVVTLDTFITVFALLGLSRLWKKRPIYVFWIAAALLFLLAWPTKWPQYILVLTFPWSLAAAEGVGVGLGEPLRRLVAWGRSEDRQGHDRVEARIARQQLRQAVGWLLPGVIVITLITFFPLIYQAGIALTDLTAISIRDGVSGGIWREVSAGLLGRLSPTPVSLLEPPGTREVHYVGFSLLGQIGANTGWLLLFEVVWTALVVALQLGLGVGIGLLLNRPGVRFKAFWMTLFVLPWTIPEFVGALSWLQIFDPRSGWFALASQNVPRDVVLGAVAGWQDNPLVTLLVLLLAGAWMGWPLMMLATSAGLKMIPPDVNDAAQIDGANGWQCFHRVIWPMLLPLLAPVIILRVISAFNQFYLFYVLQPPYPMFTLATMAYYLTAPGYLGGWFAAAAAISVLTVVVLIALLLWFNRWSKAGVGVTYA